MFSTLFYFRFCFYLLFIFFLVIVSFSNLSTPNLKDGYFHFIELDWPKAFARLHSLQLEEGQRRLHPPLPYSRRAMRKARKWLVHAWFPPSTTSVLRTQTPLPEDKNENEEEETLSEEALGHLLNDEHITANWLWSAVGPDEESIKEEFNYFWSLYGFKSGLPPEVYFGRAADFAVRLPIARWLIAGGIRPSDYMLYRREEVEAALAPHLGGTTSTFRLLCYDFPHYNPTVPVNPEQQLRDPFRYMLYGVRVCFEGARQSRSRLVSCHDDVVLHEDTLPEEGVAQCTTQKFFYFYSV